MNNSVARRYILFHMNSSITEFNPFVEPQELSRINQIDLTSTITLLLGAPIPFNSLGTPITELFHSSGVVIDFDIINWTPRMKPFLGAIHNLGYAGS